MSKTYYVYILASRSRNLYTGVTNNLQRRIIQHREKLNSSFTSRYNIFRLVYFEAYGGIGAAIHREKEIKAWRREKKIRLIEHRNPTWSDLSAKWHTDTQKQKTQLAELERSTETAKTGRRNNIKTEAKSEPKADPSHRPQTTRPGSG